MQAAVLKKQPYHCGSDMLKRCKTKAFSNTWKIHSRTNDNFYVLYSKIKNKIVYAPLYIHSFRFLNNRHLVKSQIFLYDNPDPQKLITVSDKLKWYRINNGLLQCDVARFMEVDRTTYSRYEENILETYPLDKLSKAAELFQIDVTDLLDDYNLFLYHNQGQQIKRLRKSLNFTQSEFAKYIDTPIGTLKSWEQNRVSIQKKTFKKLLKYYSQ